MSNKSAAIIKILTTEVSRQFKVEALERELHELEAQDDMCDVDRMMKVIDELNIIDPIAEETPNPPTILKRQKKQYRLFLLKASAICVAFILSFQIMTMTSDEGFFGRIKRTPTGIELQEDNTTTVFFYARVYNSIEEFETTNNINLLLPMWLPENLEVSNITLAYTNNEIQSLNIEYTDKMTCLNVEFNTNIPTNMSKHITHKNNETVFYIFEDFNVIQWEYDGNLYTFSFRSDISEHILRIIESIR